MARGRMPLSHTVNRNGGREGSEEVEGGGQPILGDEEAGAPLKGYEYSRRSGRPCWLQEVRNFRYQADKLLIRREAEIEGNGESPETLKRRGGRGRLCSQEWRLRCRPDTFVGALRKSGLLYRPERGWQRVMSG